MDVAHIREVFPVTRNIIYMNTGWSGPSPTSVTRRITEQLEWETNRGPATLEAVARSLEVEEALTGAVASLLHAPSECIALTQNTTQGLVIVLNGMDWRSGDELVTCSLEHPAVMLPSLFLQNSHGVRVRVADLSPRDDRETILTRIESCLSPRTRLVFLSHIQYSCGLRLPVREIADMVHRHGAYLLLDGAQCAGQIVLDMKAMDCDFYSFPGHKWLLGPDGAGSLFLRKELIPEITPRYPAYAAAENTDLAALQVKMNAASPRKFNLSTTSTALEAGMAEAIAYNQENGGAAIEARSLDLAEMLKSALRDIPDVTLTCPDEPELSSALVTFTVAGKEPLQVVEALWHRNIAGRQVPEPTGIRLCTAFFNTEDEVQRVAEALTEIARS
jgi:L-cysteine/cystine lyase